MPMLDREIYAFLLDLFPLTDDVAQENNTLCETMQRTALDLLTAANAGFPISNLLSKVELLLRLFHDLGYVDDEVHEFLRRQLERLLLESSRGDATI
jgi:hypothetical protein